MVSIVVLANAFSLISSYNGLYQPMYLRPIYWALVLEGLIHQPGHFDKSAFGNALYSRLYAV